MKKLLQTTIMYFLVLNAFSQEKPLRSYPPSPDAAKIAQFDFYPPNLYTGTQSVAIPLYDFNFDGTEISLNLAYHASGIRVSENSSNVGLGWVLQPIGSITRNVNGFDDLANYSSTNRSVQGYLHDLTQVPSQYVDNWVNNYLVGGLRDTEPDVFSYSFLNSSGRFIFKKKTAANSPISIIKLQENTDKIEFNLSTNTFTITDENGFQAIFSIKEYTTSISGKCGASWNNCDMNQIDFNSLIFEGGRLITTWYISKIISPNGRELLFNYDINNSNGFSDYFSIGPFNWSESESFSIVSNITQETWGFSRQIVENIILTSIQSNHLDLKINFNYSSRLDIEKMVNSSSNPIYQNWLNIIKTDRGNYLGGIKDPVRLNGITVRNINPSNFSKDIIFNQGYFNPNVTDKLKLSRLKLNSLSIDDQTYSFTYFDGLPSKESKGIDYWGYYNGKDGNTALKPVILLYPNFGINYPNYLHDNFYYQSPNRSADFAYGKAGLLNSITYPTGGKSSFEYEAHQYKLEGTEIVSPQKFVLYKSGLESASTTSFYYKGYGVSGCGGSLKLTIFVRCKDFYPGGVPCSINQNDLSKVAVQLLDPAGNVIRELNYGWLHYLNVRSHTLTEDFPAGPIGPGLAAGNYTVKVFNVKSNGQTIYYGDARVEMNSSCTNEPPIFANSIKNQFVGGARIKKITLFDESDNRVGQKSYQYLNRSDVSLSSGRLMNPLFHMSAFKMGNVILQDGTNSGVTALFYQNTSGSALENGNSAQGNHVGYSEVRVIHEDGNGGTNGFEDYVFINKPNQLTSFDETNAPQLLGSVKMDSFEDENGKNKNYKSRITPSNSVNKEVVNEFERTGFFEINAVKLKDSGGAIPLQTYYTLKNYSFNLVSKTTHMNGFVTKELYSYTAKNQIKSHKKIVELNSSMVDTISTNFKYIP